MTKQSSNTVNASCPHCKKADTWQQDNPYRPFCSDRCKLIDLGDWAAEKHRLPDESTDGKIFDQQADDDSEL